MNNSKEKILVIHWNGRFGNRMHTYAYCVQYAEKFNLDFYTPSHWEGSWLFKNQYHKIIADDHLRLYLNQSIQPFDSLNYRWKMLTEYANRTGDHFNYLNPDDPNVNWKYHGSVAVDSLCAYHPSIFEQLSAKKLKEEVFVFSDHVKNTDLYKRMEDRQGTYDIAHLRRNDVSNVNVKDNTGYSVISKESYLNAFAKFGYDPEHVEWTTDDLSGKWGVGNPYTYTEGKQFLGWTYPTGSGYDPQIIFDWFPDFLRLYFARTVFRANSSFSWWACFLGNQDKVFSPRLDKRVLYAQHQSYMQEANFEFEEGNHPHWLCLDTHPCKDIIIN